MNFSYFILTVFILFWRAQAAGNLLLLLLLLVVLIIN